MPNVFQKITKEMQERGLAIRNYNAVRWFTNHIANLNKTTKASVKRMSTPAIGKMFLLSYLPKHKDTLPYYDINPLIFVMKIEPDGFLGLNLHYLSPNDRTFLIKALISIDSNNDKMDDTTRLKISYKLLSTFSQRKRASVCVKKYLFTHVANIGLIPPNQWINTVFLPLEGFRKKGRYFSRTTVWQESADKIKRI